jgi:5-formyltetrahydrofolate cyclo-ligase
MASMHDKAAIREHFLHVRKNRTSDEYGEKSRLISERLLEFCRGQSFDVVHTFLPMTGKGEPDISTFITTSLDEGLSLIVPEVVRGQLEMQHHWYRLETEVHDGHWGVSVPKVSDSADPRMADAVLVPMLAVDTNGYRVGYGKGYYDYFLSKLDAIFIGVCFDDEVIDAVSHESHDVPVHYIISENRTEKVIR